MFENTFPPIFLLLADEKQTKQNLNQNQTKPESETRGSGVAKIIDLYVHFILTHTLFKDSPGHSWALLPGLSYTCRLAVAPAAQASLPPSFPFAGSGLLYHPPPQSPDMVPLSSGREENLSASYQPGTD